MQTRTRRRQHSPRTPAIPRAAPRPSPSARFVVARKAAPVSDATVPMKGLEKQQPPPVAKWAPRPGTSKAGSRQSGGIPRIPVGRSRPRGAAMRSPPEDLRRRARCGLPAGPSVGRRDWRPRPTTSPSSPGSCQQRESSPAPPHPRPAAAGGSRRAEGTEPSNAPAPRGPSSANTARTPRRNGPCTTRPNPRRAPRRRPRGPRRPARTGSGPPKNSRWGPGPPQACAR
mmetsp:Transcript_117685/g.375040  ORF Transcript_117685/g.375040 Transcript_117685/m.375040 type:complete len:228 (-) Transcript_117685:73-756(-)